MSELWRGSEDEAARFLEPAGRSRRAMQRELATLLHRAYTTGYAAGHRDAAGEADDELADLRKEARMLRNELSVVDGNS